MHHLAKYTDQAYALLRIVTGLMFEFHVVQKLFGVLTDFQPAVGSQLCKQSGTHPIFRRFSSRSSQ